MARLVKVTFLPPNQAVEVDLDLMPYKGCGRPGSLLDIALNHGIQLAHTCGGNCICTTCHVLLKQGKELVSEPEECELDRLDLAADLRLDSRLGCQTVVTKAGELVVEIPAWQRS